VAWILGNHKCNQRRAFQIKHEVAAHTPATRLASAIFGCFPKTRANCTAKVAQVFFIAFMDSPCDVVTKMKQKRARQFAILPNFPIITITPPAILIHREYGKYFPSQLQIQLLHFIFHLDPLCNLGW